MQDNCNDVKIVKTNGRKKDFIHKYFIKNDDNICCNIDNCNSNFSQKSSTSTLKYHILMNHADKPIKNIPPNNINSIMNDSNEDDLYNSLSSFFSKNSLPHSLVEDKYFKNLIDVIKKSNNINLNKKKLRNAILLEGKKINENILDKLGLSNQPVTLAIDGWTNVRSNKVTNLLLISNDTAYYYTSIENINNRNNTEWLGFGGKN